MKLIEAIIWILILSLILLLGANYFMLSWDKFSVYLTKLWKDAEKISLYNYSSYLITKINTQWTWYVVFTWNNFETWTKWDFYFNCNYKTWTLIKTPMAYTWLFCELQYDSDKIYNYKILEN